MRMLLNVTLPGPQEGNCRRSWKRSLTSSSTQRSGTKPEACYFTEQEGRRGALLVVGPSRSLADPVSRRAMVPELQRGCGIPRGHDAGGVGEGRPGRPREEVGFVSAALSRLPGRNVSQRANEEWHGAPVEDFSRVSVSCSGRIRMCRRRPRGGEMILLENGWPSCPSAPSCTVSAGRLVRSSVMPASLAVGRSTTDSPTMRPVLDWFVIAFLLVPMKAHI